MSERSNSLVVRAGQPLLGVLVQENGQEVTRFFVGESAPQSGPSAEDIQAALGVIGAWSDMDWEDLANGLDRIRHESEPTPPFEP